MAEEFENIHPLAVEPGLDDHSEELADRSDVDAQVRFYRAMAEIDVGSGNLLDRLARAVAEVVFDLCLVYLVDPERPGAKDLTCAAAYHPHQDTLQNLHHFFADLPRGGDGLVRHVIQRQTQYFRPRFSPGLLQPYSKEQLPELLVPIHSLIVVPVITADGRCHGALLVGRHATTLSYSERDLALMEWIASHTATRLDNARLYRDLQAAVQERDTFISIAAHELRTPLSTMKLQAQMLRRTAQRNPAAITATKVLEKMDYIDRSVDRVDALIDQLLNVSRIMEGALAPQLAPCDLRPLVDDAITRLRFELDASGSTLENGVQAPVQGHWDEVRLDHILTNLLSNAIKYGRGRPIALSCHQTPEFVALEVRDQGFGIAPEHMDRIFARFERGIQGSRKGLGLGLWIVREYVESMAGTIEVESVLDEGSTFRIRLPRHPAL